mgnify:CR=1 FL=1|jgi:hypothetical protein
MGFYPTISPLTSSTLTILRLGELISKPSSLHFSTVDEKAGNEIVAPRSGEVIGDKTLLF